MRVRRVFADTPQGQVHFRYAGAGIPVVLMHWAPASSRQHVGVMELLSERDFQVIAPDLLGYGDSDKPQAQCSIADYARNLGELLDVLGLDGVCLYGGHTTAAVAAEFAATTAVRVRRLALDGSPVLDAADRAARAGKYTPPLELHADGSHMQQAWKRAYRNPAMSLEEVFADCVDFLKAGATYHTGYEAVWAYDMAPRLPQLTMPTLAITTPDDPLADAHRRVLAEVPDCREFVGAPRYSQTVAERDAQMARVLGEFFSPGG
ncbi:MAG: alpha/beta fold hydrolase [Proteobacteria bacterium]|nr:alpha/beta fold hydrolase [Pseudomonadota bacterium]